MAVFMQSLGRFSVQQPEDTYYLHPHIYIAIIDVPMAAERLQSGREEFVYHGVPTVLYVRSFFAVNA